MDIGVPGDQGDNGEVDPLRRFLIERVERDQEWQRPELEHDGGGDTAVDDLAHDSHGEQAGHAKHDGRYAQQIGLDGGEAQVTQGESEICLWRADGDCRARDVKDE